MTQTDTIVGASPFEQELYDHVTGHVEDEREVLQAYEELAATTDSAAFRYAAELILAEERRHHQMLADLALTVRRSAELSPDPGPIPFLDLHKDRDAILAATERLLAVEDQDRKDLKRLAKELEPFEDTTLWALLVELMRADNEKHRTILKFVRKHTRGL
jgi:hypothetical protein